MRRLCQQVPYCTLSLDQSSIAQCEESECHFKVGFSAGLLVQQEAEKQIQTKSYDE